jgi:hypothetical protein
MASPRAAANPSAISSTELALGPLVHALGAGAQGQAQHHVGQVDPLAPGGRADLGEEHVDQQHAAVADQQVGRLDVAVGQPGRPQPPDDGEAVVDHPVVDLGLAELDGLDEELGDQQVLTFRGELDHAVGPWRGQPGQVQLLQGVVLLLDQPAHGVERLLVLQAPIQQLPAQLVPAVGPQVAAGVQLAEQPGVGVALDGDAQRGRAG